MARRKTVRTDTPAAAAAPPPPQPATPPWRFVLRPRLGEARSTARLPPPPPGYPAQRRLRVYAQDPSLHSDDAAVHTLLIPCEPLKPGPEGALFVVEPLPALDAEGKGLPARGRRPAADRPKMAEPVDLDAPEVLMQDGLPPSTTDRRFMQQMVYAVCMETYARFMRALGRDPGFGPLQGPGREDGRLRIQAMDDSKVKEQDKANAYYDRDTSRLVFGYGRAAGGGHGQSGDEVYIALSRDVACHEMSHALLDSLRPNFLRPTHRDIGGLHEGIADIVALFLRFTQREAVERAIARSDGGLRDDLLLFLGRQFGFDLINGSNDPMRRVSVDDPYYTKIPPHERYRKNKEDHDLGQVLVSAAFDAFNTVYEREVAPVRQSLAMYQGRLPEAGVRWLAKEASRFASRFLDIAIRAIDYCPPLHCSFGEYLRAMITADVDVTGADGAPYREILIASFRKFGITLRDVPTLSEDSLRWRAPTTPISIPALAFGKLPLRFERGQCDWADGDGLRAAAQALGEAVCRPEHAHDVGLMAPNPRRGIQPPMVLSLRPLRRVSPAGDVHFDLVAELVQKRKVREGWFLGGATLVISSTGEVRYAIAKRIDSERRLKEQRLWLSKQPHDVRASAWHEHSGLSAARIAKIHAHKAHVHRDRSRAAAAPSPRRR
jgi:hypothetical protein